MGNKIESGGIRWCSTIKYLVFLTAKEASSFMKNLRPTPRKKGQVSCMFSFEKQNLPAYN